MSLFVVATPIGNPKDITLRAIETLQESDVIIGEEKRELMPFLKKLSLHEKEVRFLNEHTRDIDELAELCRDKKVSLVSDCGTPGFCDPGADLVAKCRSLGVAIQPVPGVTSLMTLLSVSGVRLDQFLFLGFLPSDKIEREESLTRLKNEKRSFILMDTPYRMGRVLSELSQRIPERKAILGMDLTQSSEEVATGKLSQLCQKFPERKAEFVLLVI